MGFHGPCYSTIITYRWSTGDRVWVQSHTASAMTRSALSAKTLEFVSATCSAYLIGLSKYIDMFLKGPKFKKHLILKLAIEVQDSETLVSMQQNNV